MYKSGQNFSAKIPNGNFIKRVDFWNKYVIIQSKMFFVKEIVKQGVKDVFATDVG
jgi:hypothetical protein